MLTGPLLGAAFLFLLSLFFIYIYIYYASKIHSKLKEISNVHQSRTLDISFNLTWMKKLTSTGALIPACGSTYWPPFVCIGLRAAAWVLSGQLLGGHKYVQKEQENINISLKRNWYFRGTSKHIFSYAGGCFPWNDPTEQQKKLSVYVPCLCINDNVKTKFFLVLLYSERISKCVIYC